MPRKCLTVSPWLPFCIHQGGVPGIPNCQLWPFIRSISTLQGVWQRTDTVGELPREKSASNRLKKTEAALSMLAFERG
ncbi:hypothetical protein PN498_09740 [Oscillatoria sp. CS-180]|nr:hypothetical protein [Oscillatoria sp. CS-180]